MSTRQPILNLRAKMLINGQSIREWARSNNFNEETVHAVVRRHWGRDTKPVGEMTIRILEQLYKDFGNGEGT